MRADIIADYEDMAAAVYADKIKADSRKLPLFDNVLQMLGDLLKPETEGYRQINRDMTFTTLDSFDRERVQHLSMNINIMRMWGLNNSLYFETGELATLLNSNRSKGGKSMDLFTTTVTKGETLIHDKHEEIVAKGGFFNFARKRR